MNRGPAPLADMHQPDKSRRRARLAAAIFALVPGIALAHGGEDHSAPPPPLASPSDSGLVTWSTEFEAVVRLPYAAPGEVTHGTALVADWRTSAPVEAGSIAIGWSGPAPVQVDVPAPSQPGVFAFDATFPTHGSYAGGLTVLTETRADMLGLPAYAYEQPHDHEGDASGWGGGWLAGALVVGIGGGVLLGLIFGFGFGRVSRKIAPVLALGALFVGADRVLAHGGEDHGAPAAPVATGGGIHLPMESQFLLGVRTDVVREQPFADTVRVLGRTVLRPGGGAEITAPVAGTVTLADGITPGMRVEAGQVLGTVRESLSGPERADVVVGQSGARADLARARKELALAERDAERAQQVEGVLSERERMERAKAVEVAREVVRQAEIAVGGTGSQTTTLRAPVAGQLAALDARPGQAVSEGDPLFTIVADGPLWVEAQVPQALAGRIAQGAPAMLAADARPGDLIAAVVLDPGLKADPTSGMLRVTLAIEGSHDWLVPGVTITGFVTVGGERRALVVPDDAIVESSGETLVFVKTAPETFVARPVRLGPLSAGRREVREGVEAGERVVLSGTYALRSMAGR